MEEELEGEQITIPLIYKQKLFREKNIKKIAYYKSGFFPCSTALRLLT